MNKKLITLAVAISILAEGSLISSCSKTNDFEGPHTSDITTIDEKVAWLPIIILGGMAIEGITQVMKGKPHVEYETDINGDRRIKRKWCEGVFGTCDFSTIDKNTGMNISNSQPFPSYEESASFDSYLLKTDKGILFAADKNDNVALESFFYSDTINIQTEVLVDNADVLSQLGETSPFVIFGQYTVYYSNDYVYIIIKS